jgi:aspartyl-tRNA(Asn)/glutamyl-tRNA(Gln) amidotransferase subunit C
MPLSDDQVRRIARLARIALEAGESEAVLDRLNRVLGLIDEMRAVDTRGIEPMAHARDVVQRLRSDEVTDADRRQIYQSIAPAGPDGQPQVQDGLYLVPKVIE